MRKNPYNKILREKPNEQYLNTIPKSQCLTLKSITSS